MPGEEVPPGSQHLSDAETKEKEIKVYDLAIEELNSYWNGKLYDDYEVRSLGMPCSENENSIFSDWETLESFFKCTNKAKLD